MHSILTDIDDLLLESSQLRCKIRFDNLLPEIYEVEDDYEIDELNRYICNDGDCHCGEVLNNIGFICDPGGMWVMRFRANYETLLYLVERYGEDHTINIDDKAYKVGDILSKLNESPTKKVFSLTLAQE